MAYQIVIQYRDEKTATISVSDQDIDFVYKQLGRGEILTIVNAKTKVGFWSRLDNVRHIIIKKQEPVESVQQETDGSDKELPSED